MLTLSDLPVSGKRVLVRADLNVPLVHDETGTSISDDGRIRASVPTIRELADAGARVIVVAHLGRPKGKPDPELSLAIVAKRLADLVDKPVTFVPFVSGHEVQQVVSNMHDGDITVLENVRFDPRETSKDVAEREALANELAALADEYVSDGFGVVHREQASVTDVARRLPRAVGRLVEEEVSVFDQVLNDPQRPLAVVMGGAKVSDKLAVISNLLPRIDQLLIGGGMCFTFLAARGFEVGSSLVEVDQIETIKGVMAAAQEQDVELVLPIDIVVGREFAADTETRTVPADSIPAGWMGLDIGPATAELFQAKLATAGTVVWNGPMGVFEWDNFSAGTRTVATALAESAAFTVVGGGDSAAAIRHLGIPEENFSHISTGGGASLEFLEGRVLPGLAVLEEG